MIDKLLSRLDGVRSAGNGRWYARCPAHDDRKPSLSIRDDGEILIYCFVGCSSDDVLSAVGLEWRDLYPDPWECARLRPNSAARRAALKAQEHTDRLDIERMVLRIAAEDRRANKTLSLEDRARVAVARERLTNHG